MAKTLSTIDKIINTSINLFYDKTYAATTIQDISRESEASVGSIYHAFKNGKSDIATFIIDKYYTEFKLEMSNVLQQDIVNTPIETIVDNLINTLITIGTSYPCMYDSSFLASQTNIKDQDKSLKTEVIGYTATMIQIKNPKLKRIDAEFKATINFAIWDSLLSEYEKTNDKRVLQELKSIAINYLK
jgi:AcrR family transcriptional regulator